VSESARLSYSGFVSTHQRVGSFPCATTRVRLAPVAVGAGASWEAVVYIGGGLLVLILIVIILVMVLR